MTPTNDPNGGRMDEIPDKIPNDVMAIAISAADEVSFGGYEQNALLIARAILAERERAAGIIDAANAHYGELHEASKAGKDRGKTRDLQTMRIATAGLSSLIRKGKTP